ncbi:2-oxoglutarate dehydrogenase, E2 component, dihydrolipoamide succinyltransferase, partial [Corynebacterium sp.]|uniref:2-oxoglutarate dehydrogenase, E2 component, dihydrolipoamide succinyltransferase n=1 Tax=Corynebacterium sp. TaxID=1720 RepID=UPI0026375F7E
MAQSVEMPELGESVTEGTITQWLKKVGDKVEVDEPLLEVSTDKVDTEIPSPVAGVLLKVMAEEDDTIEVGSIIAEIGEEDEAPSSDDEGDDSSDEDEAADSSDEDAAEDSDESSDDSDSEGSGEGEDVTMPELGESVTEGTITQWLKSVGDKVEVDEPLLEVSTDKVDTEIPSTVAGTLVEILADEDDTVEVGDVIARIGDGEAKPAKKEEPKKEKSEDKSSEKAASKDEQKSEEKDSGKDKAASAREAAREKAAETTARPNVADRSEKSGSAGEPSGDNLPYVTPLVRKLAEKNNVDLSKVTGTGVGGRIRKQDVLAAAEGDNITTGAKTNLPAGPRASAHKVDPNKQELIGTTQKVNRIREITARTTLESLRNSAQLTQVHEVDMTLVADLRAKSKKAFQDAHGVNLTFLPFFAKAAVEALISHPNVNASYNAETKEMTYHDRVNLSIAVDTKDGLLSPVIHDAQDLSLPELAKAIADIADRARNKKLKPNDLAGGTFTITNIGSEGALTDTPILVPPQAAMVGTGAIVKRPVVLT